MLKQQWLLLDCWAVANQYRVFFKDLAAAHLIDITIENQNIEGIINEVVGGSWTAEELIDHLNKKVISNDGLKGFCDPECVEECVAVRCGFCCNCLRLVSIM